MPGRRNHSGITASAWTIAPALTGDCRSTSDVNTRRPRSSPTTSRSSVLGTHLLTRQLTEIVIDSVWMKYDVDSPVEFFATPDSTATSLLRAFAPATNAFPLPPTVASR